MKKLKSILEKIKNPSRKVLIVFAGLVGVAGGYTWARYTFEDNIANNSPNTIAGYLIIVGVAVVVYGLVESNVKSRSKAVAERNKRKKKKSKKSKSK